MAALPAVVSSIQGGTLRALAVTTEQRWPGLPDVPAVAESGYPGYEALNWYGFLGPKGLPKEIVDRLNREIVKALATPDIRQRASAMDFEVVGSAPDEFGAEISRDIARWGKVIRDAGIKPR